MREQMRKRKKERKNEKAEIGRGEKNRQTGSCWRLLLRLTRKRKCRHMTKQEEENAST